MNLGNILEGTWMVKMVKKIKVIGRKKAPGLRMKRFVRRRRRGACSHCYRNLVLDKGFYIVSRRSWRVFHQYDVVLWGHLLCRADGIFRCSVGQRDSPFSGLM